MLYLHNDLHRIGRGVSPAAAVSDEGMANDNNAAKWQEIFRTEWLGSVVFVMDYVQFVFNGPRLTAYTRPTIENKGQTLRWNDAGYRDALCDLITHYVTETTIRENDAIELKFDTGAIIRISLKDDDYEGPEAATFMANLPNDKRWWVY